MIPLVRTFRRLSTRNESLVIKTKTRTVIGKGTRVCIVASSLHYDQEGGRKKGGK